jgi:hypothetical protein
VTLPDDLPKSLLKFALDPANPLCQLAMRTEPDFPIVTWVILRKPARA